MNWRISRIAAFAYRNFIFSKRNLFAFFEILFWPAVGIVSIGLMGTFLELTPELRSFILTGAIVSGVLQVTQLDVSYGLLYDIWSKSLKQTFLAPVHPSDYIIGSWVVGAVRGVLTYVLLALFSSWTFRFYVADSTAAGIALFGVLLNALIIGMFVNYVIFMFGQRADIITWSVSVLEMLVCGIYYPVTYLPPFVQRIAEIIPLTYFLEYFRAGYGYRPVYGMLLAKGFGLSAVYIALLFLVLGRAYERARINGMIVRLSE
mgnify:CR=1 FL=1